MTPLATTTVTVLEPGAHEPAEPATWTTLVEGVAGHLSSPIGLEALGVQEIVDYRLDCEPVALDSTHRVTDDTTGETFEVVWARTRRGLGLDHTVAALRHVAGVA